MDRPLPNEASLPYVELDGHTPAPGSPAGTTARKATVIELSGRPSALLRLDDGRTLDVLLLDGIRHRCQLGNPALAYFDRTGSLVGWYLPEAGIGVDLRSR